MTIQVVVLCCGSEHCSVQSPSVQSMECRCIVDRCHIAEHITASSEKYVHLCAIKQIIVTSVKYKQYTDRETNRERGKHTQRKTDMSYTCNKHTIVKHHEYLSSTELITFQS